MRGEEAFALTLLPPTANLDFEARVPVPFSLFPSTYRESEAQAADSTKTTTTSHEEVDIKLPHRHHSAGREGQYSSPAENSRRGDHVGEEDVRFRREQERSHRPGKFTSPFQPRFREEYTESHIDTDRIHRPYSSPIDLAERQYRERFRPSSGFTVESSRSVYQEPQSSKPFTETVEPPVFSIYEQKAKMGYHDNEGQYHTYRHGLHKLTDKVVHPEGHHRSHETTEVKESRGGGGFRDSYVPNTVTIPCHHIRLGDFLMLQGRPCQVIRISTSGATGQYRYLGVDLFSKQLHEESSFISHPGPSVVVQTMLGPIFKQYRVLDIHEGSVVAMTESGDIKQSLPIIDQSNLWTRLQSAFESGRGSVRVLVLNDQGRELVVDMKVLHGSNL